MFPPTMNVTHCSHLDIHGAPHGEYLFCAGFFANKHAEVRKLLSRLEQVFSIDPQVGFSLLYLYSGCRRMVHFLVNSSKSCP